MRAVPGAPDDLDLALDLVVETKPDLTPVSEAARAVERAMREHLASRRPEDTVFGEEYGEADATAGSGTRRWIVDPIDGTKGYVRGMPVWGTLLALEDAGEMVIGVVSAPAMGRRWWAARGAGAFTTDTPNSEPRRLLVSGIRGLGDAQMCFGGFEEWRQTGRLAVLEALAES